MEKKKNAHANLTKSRGLYINIGLVISLAFMLAAFEWKSYSSIATINLAPIETDFDELVEVKATIQPPPPPPIKMIVEVENKVELLDELKPKIDVEITEKMSPENYNIEDLKDEPIEDSIFFFVETQPSFKGGIAAFYKYIGKEIKYPSQARSMRIEGKVFLEFVINKEGAITNIKVLRGIGGGCDKEAIRVLQNAPKWNAGKQRGKAVNVKMVLPITFKLT